MKGSTKFLLYVYSLPLVDPNHICVVDLDFVLNFQQTLECMIEENEIQNLTPFNDFDQALPPFIGFNVSSENIDHVESDLKSTLVSVKVMARYMLAKEKFEKDLKLITLEDHQWQLRFSDPKSMGVVEVCSIK